MLRIVDGRNLGFNDITDPTLRAPPNLWDISYPYHLYDFCFYVVIE